MPLTIGRAYGLFLGNLPLQAGDYFLEAAQDNITAHAGGGQSAAFPITTQTARITTVATVGDSILLPPSTPGLEMLIINHGANAMQVYGTGTDQIDDQAAATGVSQMANSLVIYTCATAGNWYSEGLATGFSKATGLQTVSYTTIAANVGGTQATGTPVTSMLNNVTVAGGSYSVTLPVSAPGMEITIHNLSTANTLLVYPNAGGTGTESINGAAANGSFSMALSTSALFTCVVAGAWWTVPRVAS